MAEVSATPNASESAGDQHLLSDGLARSLVRNSGDGLVVIDREGRISYASPAAEEMLGYAPGSVRGLDAFDLVHPEDQVTALEGFESTVSAKDSRPLPLLVRLRRADGAWHQTEVIGTNRLDDEHIEGVLLSIRDVSASMRTDAALRASEEQHRLIVELAREGIWMVDADGRTTFANRALAELLDTTVADMLGRTIDEFIAGMQDSRGRRSADAEVGSGEHEVCLLTREGREIWARINASPITDHAKQNLGMVALVSDVTERRMLEQSLAMAARRDPLTNLANRLELFERLASTLATPALVTVLYIDLDGFKHVNDSHGHGLGDELLRAAALRIRAAVREVDLVARVGGDEFVIVTDGIGDATAALGFGRRICESLERPFTIGDTYLRVGACIGVAFATGGDADAVLAEADDALYRAKRAETSRVEIAGVPPAIAQRR
jgi:diguanylate cyclase (GGDEF)-like protein/PAS domain S-box-containing protein